MVTAVLFNSTWNNSPIILVISGVAILNVVAVPAINANTASKSMILPRIPSVRFPRIGRHASEYFCLSRFLTCNMNPNATASTR